jgi:polyhydroxyalkanoate synthesis regulator phasin
MEERRCRFVDGSVTRLALSADEWIEVKTELNAGEARKVFTDVIREAKAGQAWDLDPEKVGPTQVLAYVTRWSLLDAQGQPVEVTETTLNALDQDTYQEILAAVERHDAACEAKRIARKNGQAGETASPRISPSLVAVGGASTGSAH